MFNSGNQIVSKFVEKLLKYRIVFKDILTTLVIDYRDALLTLSSYESVFQKSDESDYYTT